MCRLAAADSRILLLTGDLGYMVMEPFRQQFPDRFFNVGVAEQNMIGLATGLAEAGFLPYTYSIATFASLRPFEFIRNGPVLHNLPVRMVGMGAGFEYGHAGPTHYGTEDIAALRTLPGLTVVIPADPAQTVTAMEVTSKLPGPVYYSLGKDDRAVLPQLGGRFELGRAQFIGAGGDVAIVSMGSLSREAVAAADELAARGIKSTVAVVSNFNPDPNDDLAELLAHSSQAITVEAQAISGGLGACVATIIATHGLSCRLRTLAVKTSPDGTSGSQEDRWRKHGLDRGSIVSSVLAKARVAYR
ncbi:MAG TPA: transketolase C-terminal domain-containing protein [Bryobacteraceae bacterium]|nr:transketolase C-terminal domain-containing protein [Bryobacteraceae bacterium]